MAKAAKASTGNIAAFFERLRQDTGLQGQVLGEVAHAAPELLAKIAHDHGYSFTEKDLKQLMEDRALRSLQGEVFWSMIGLIEGRRPNGTPFGQIKGPSWVNQAPYRKALLPPSEEVPSSLYDLFREIESEAS